MENRDLFPLDVASAESLDQFYHCFGTFRKTSATQAPNEAVTSTDVDIVNRWKTVESARSSIPSRPMRQHYIQLELLLRPFLRYTGAM